MIILFDRRSLAVVFTAIALTAIAGIACGAKPEKEFPEFKAEKSQIGEIALLTDVVVVEDVLGNTEKVYLEDCKRLADIMLQTFRDGLAPKGYTFRRSTVLSIGDLVNPKSQYRVLQTWVQHKEDDSQFPVTEPPFYEDSTVAAVSGGHEALRAVLNGTWTFKISKKEPPPTLSEISTLHDAIGTDYALLVVVLGTKVPFGKQMGQGMLSQLMTVGGTARGSHGNVTFSANPDFTQYSGTGIRTALVDCRTGRVLWADGDHEDRSLNDGNLASLAKDVIKRMP